MSGGRGHGTGIIKNKPTAGSSGKGAIMVDKERLAAAMRELIAAMGEYTE